MLNGEREIKPNSTIKLITILLRLWVARQTAQSGALENLRRVGLSFFCFFFNGPTPVFDRSQRSRLGSEPTADVQLYVIPTFLLISQRLRETEGRGVGRGRTEVGGGGEKTEDADMAED